MFEQTDQLIDELKLVQKPVLRKGGAK